MISSPWVAAIARCLAFNSGSSTISASLRCIDLTARRRRIGVETLGQQWMCEPEPVTVDPDDAFALDVFELFDDVLGGGLGCSGHQLDGRCRMTCHRQQHIARGVAEAAYPGPDEFGERHRQWHLGASAMPPSIARANSRA